MRTQNIDEARLKERVYGDTKLKIIDTEGQEYELHVDYDEYPDDPRLWDNVGTMICQHKKYSFGDHDEKHYDNFLNLLKKCGKTDDEIEEMCFGEQIEFLCNQENVCALPLYIYDHGGISMSTGSVDSWDSSAVGVIFVEQDDFIKKTGLIEKCWKTDAERYLNSEIETYSNYLEGNVYQYTLYKVTPVIVTKETKDGRVLSCTDEVEIEPVDSLCGLYNLTIGDLYDNLPIDIKQIEEIN